MSIAFWIPKATNTHSQYVILIVSPLQQWLNQGASMLLYTHIACLISATSLYTISCKYFVFSCYGF